MPIKAVLFKSLDFHKSDWLLNVLKSCFANEDKSLCKSDWLLAMFKNIDFSLEKLQNNDQIWTEVKDNLEEKFFVVASQLKDIRLNEKQIIATQENHARILSNAISVIESNSRSLMACSQYFYARDQKLKLQT